jgi:hypothetical protein
MALASPETATGQTIYPSADGTLGDGVAGPFDGVADDADWYFNQSGYEGSIALRLVEDTSFEHRVVWEYNLSGVSLDPPVTASLTFTIRGAPIWPLPDVEVHVYAYPADLLETLDDFSSEPTELQGFVTIVPYQDPTEYAIDVSGVVSDALTTGEDKVAFRFQVDPDTVETRQQAFIDAIDSDPTTKPYLTITEGPPGPGDGNGDGVVDLADYALFFDCLTGPEMPAPAGCGAFKFDADLDVDLADFAAFQRLIPDES